MESSHQAPSKQTDLFEAQLRKLNLEISSLEWQNSKIGRLTRLATIFTISATLATIVATLFGLWQGYSKSIVDRQNERDLKVRELTERVNNQYRSDLQQLLQYPVDEKQTIPAIIFLFQDIEGVVENGYQGKNLEDRRYDVGNFVARLIMSSQFDFKETRSIEFDKAALESCKYYSKVLVDKPSFNREILSKYEDSLSNLPRSKRESYKEVGLDPDDRLTGYVGPLGFEDETRHFIRLARAYKLHLELFNKSLEEHPADTAMIRVFMNKSICNFYSDTLNLELTEYISGDVGASLRQRLQQCAD